MLIFYVYVLHSPKVFYLAVEFLLYIVVYFYATTLDIFNVFIIYM